MPASYVLQRKLFGTTAWTPSGDSRERHNMTMAIHGMEARRYEIKNIGCFDGGGGDEDI